MFKPASKDIFSPGLIVTPSTSISAVPVFANDIDLHSDSVPVCVSKPETPLTIIVLLALSGVTEGLKDS